MGKYVPDPEIDRLVQEMNRLVERDAEAVGEDAGSIHNLDDPSIRTVAAGEGLGEMLIEMVRRGASDLILVPGAQPVLRVDGLLERLGGEVAEEKACDRSFRPTSATGPGEF